MQVVIQPPSLIETGIKVEMVNNRPLFKFTDRLQLQLESLLEKNKINSLTAEEQEELKAINELDRLFTYLNSLLIAQQYKNCRSYSNWSRYLRSP
ncbi:MAG: hypothetical protein MUE44_03185 [Oscillatoriaceae cyanobacterium Prado104]|jgi:hypothetical protein|nr:hypothetical protein [Oscillatoriaceae cyanobacterium Prado104]